MSFWLRYQVLSVTKGSALFLEYEVLHELEYPGWKVAS